MSTADTAGAAPIAVVLVDDHKMVVEALGAALGDEAGLELVGTAHNAQRAVQIAEQLRPDVMLLDHQLPDGEGARVAAVVRAASPATRVVILTATVQPQVVAQALEAGCVGVLAKDTSLREIAGAIRTVHAGGTAFAPDALAAAVGRLRHTAHDLSDRELQVLKLVARGTSTTAIAEELFLSVHTVRNHVRRITEKLGVHSKLEAVTEATRRGLVRLD